MRVHATFEVVVDLPATGEQSSRHAVSLPAKTAIQEHCGRHATHELTEQKGGNRSFFLRDCRAARALRRAASGVSVLPGT